MKSWFEPPPGRRWRWKFEPVAMLGSSFLISSGFRWVTGRNLNVLVVIAIGAAVGLLLGFRLVDMNEGPPESGWE